MVDEINRKTKSGLGLALIIIGFFLPLIGIIMIIIGIVLGFKARKINPDETLGLVNIILGFMLLLLHLLIVPFVLIVFFQLWFTSYQSGINEKIEQQSQVSSSSFVVERVESNGNVYIKSTGSRNGIVDIKIPEHNCLIEDAPIKTSSITMLSFENCPLIGNEKIDVVIVGEDGVFTSTQLVR